MNIEALESTVPKVKITPAGNTFRPDSAAICGVAYTTFCQWEAKDLYGLKRKRIRVGRCWQYPFTWIKLIAEGKVNKDGTLVDSVGDEAA